MSDRDRFPHGDESCVSISHVGPNQQSSRSQEDVMKTREQQSRLLVDLWLSIPDPRLPTVMTVETGGSHATNQPFIRRGSQFQPPTHRRHDDYHDSPFHGEDSVHRSSSPPTNRSIKKETRNEKHS